MAQITIPRWTPDRHCQITANTDLEKTVERLKFTADFVMSPHKGYVIDENLQIVEKFGFWWIVLTIVDPFCSLFCYDVFSHVRVTRVAEKVLGLCQEIKTEFNERPQLVQLIKEEIIDPLNQATHRKYANQVEEVSTQLMKLMPKPANIPEIIWPEDLNGIGLNQKQKTAIDEALQEIFNTMRENPKPYYKLCFLKQSERIIKMRDLCLQDLGSGGWMNHPSEVQKVSVPLSLRISYHPNGLVLDKITILTKQIIARGSQTKVRRCYDLLSGKTFVRKKSNNSVQMEVLEKLYNHPVPGVVRILGFPNKGEFYEEEYPYDLLSFLQQNNVSFEEAVDLMKQLIQGLANLHAISHPGIQYAASLTECHSTGPFNPSHSDIKPNNILIKKNKDDLEAVITDLGYVSPLEIGGTFGYKSPEAMNFSGNNTQTVNFKLENGQVGDAWSMGLVFVLLLTNETRVLPNLASIWTAATKHKKEEDSIISQHKLDDELDLLKAKNYGGVKKKQHEKFKQVWECIYKMLRVHKEARISANEALAYFT